MLLPANNTFPYPCNHTCYRGVEFPVRFSCCSRPRGSNKSPLPVVSQPLPPPPAAPADVLPAAGRTAAAEGWADLQGRANTPAGAGAQQPQERQPEQRVTSRRRPLRPTPSRLCPPISELLEPYRTSPFLLRHIPSQCVVPPWEDPITHRGLSFWLGRRHNEDPTGTQPWFETDDVPESF